MGRANLSGRTTGLPGFPGSPVLRRRPEDIPALPGAYVLSLALARPLVVTLGGAGHKLAAGRYLYCGSAYGPGGLRARIARHMRPVKPVRWHIDRLTTAAGARTRGAFVFPEGNECALALSLSQLPTPIAGFGSSDCRHCRSHLYYWPYRVRQR